MTGRHVLVARLDRLGDVLICGPAIRAVAAGAARVTVLTSPAGAGAAALLPGVDEVLGWDAPWIGAPAAPVDRGDVLALVDRLAAARIDAALVLASYHQSALPTALLLQLAGIASVAAASTDYPGSLLATRIPEPPDAPEPVRMLAIAEAAGHRLPAGDDGRLAVRLPAEPHALPTIRAAGRYVVVHPGTDAPARTYPPELWHRAVSVLVAAGVRVVVTGSPAETSLTATVAGAHALDLGGRTDLAGLAAVLRDADAVVVGNTGPAHLAAAVGTPVVSLYAPVVPAVRWAPHGVPVVLLGDQQSPCRDTRARVCPIAGHPCLSGVRAEEIAAAVASLVGVPEVVR